MGPHSSYANTAVKSTIFTQPSLMTMKVKKNTYERNRILCPTILHMTIHCFKLHSSFLPHMRDEKHGH